MTPIPVADQGILLSMFDSDSDAKTLTVHAAALPTLFFYQPLYEEPAAQGLWIEDGSVWQLQAPPAYVKGQTITPAPAQLVPTPETLTNLPDYDGWTMFVHSAGAVIAEQLPA